MKHTHEPIQNNPLDDEPPLAAAEGDPSEMQAHERLPPLMRDVAFWGMTVTQFLGAFNDNLFKQLLLLLSVSATAAAASAASSADVKSEDLQWIAMFVFALPFVLLSGFAGFLSDRYSKRSVIVLSKTAEIVVMLMGMAAFAAYSTTGLSGALTVLFLMGAQSAFFGPGKYGILPEMLRGRDLPRANGIFLMTTFLAIIVGTAFAGYLKYEFGDRLWLASSVCMLIAVVGTLTSLLTRRVRAARPNLAFRRSALVVSTDMLLVLVRDRPLRGALLASCMFWLIGGLVQPTVNALGVIQFEVDELRTSLMNAGIAVGIAAGCLAAGLLSRGRIDTRIIRVSAWGILACLALLTLPGGRHSHLLGFAGSIPMLLALGFFAGMFAVPIQVFLQSRPPEDKKGRMIATMNLANWVAILISAGLYFVFGRLLAMFQLPPSATFGLTALLMLPVALFYRPRSEQLT
jgi:acyl-[acyl-carrier-protein]-phospholipid O-acyltransferase/long-chain-fatty-acid--[acyl-carrier-protein] ligase